MTLFRPSQNFVICEYFFKLDSIYASCLLIVRAVLLVTSSRLRVSFTFLEPFCLINFMINDGTIFISILGRINYRYHYV